MILVLILVTIGFMGLIGVTSYNRLVRMRNELERSWANIDVILKQRFDEIPQLVQVVEQVAQYEAGLVKKITEARSKYAGAGNPEEKMSASNELSFALKGVLALGEAYPDIKASANFIQLQDRVSGLENTLADRRETYNDSVSNFNTLISQIPDTFIAGILKYQRQKSFEVADFERQTPSLKMNLNL